LVVERVFKEFLEDVKDFTCVSGSEMDAEVFNPVVNTDVVHMMSMKDILICLCWFCVASLFKDF